MVQTLFLNPALLEHDSQTLGVNSWERREIVMLNLDILPCRLEQLGIKLVEEGRNGQVQIHHGKLFSDAASSSTSEWDEILLQSF